MLSVAGSVALWVGPRVVLMAGRWAALWAALMAGRWVACLAVCSVAQWVALLVPGLLQPAESTATGPDSSNALTYF